MNRLAVLGRPIAHSLSPVMHTAAFRALGLDRDWSYEAIELPPEEFEAGLTGLRERGFVGANVTVPHKRAALELADRPSERASSIGAANTLSFTEDGIAADNTDAPGLIASLPDSFDPSGRSVLVLGAGGAARAAIWAMIDAGAIVAIHNRTRSRAVELAAELGASVLEEVDSVPVADFDLVVNATSIGLAGSGPMVGQSPAGLKALGIAADGFTNRQIVVDLVYGSEPTPFSAAAKGAGATVVDGLEILINQGAASFRIWTGVEPPLEAMRSALKIQTR